MAGAPIPDVLNRLFSEYGTDNTLDILMYLMEENTDLFGNEQNRILETPLMDWRVLVETLFLKLGYNAYVLFFPGSGKWAAWINYQYIDDFDSEAEAYDGIYQFTLNPTSPLPPAPTPSDLSQPPNLPEDHP